MAFIEEKLELGIDYGTVGSFRFSTNIVVLGDGSEQRNINWSQPLGRWQLGERTLTNNNLDYFLAFFEARKGAYQGFRLKDWTDWKATNQALGVGNGTKTQFQLYKTYTVGSYSVCRPITKPVAGTIKIYFDGTQQLSGWAANTTNGVITFTTAPSNAVVVTADFEFDVPVRFETDKIDFRFDAIEVSTNRKIFYLSNLTVTEIRLPLTLAIPLDSVPSELPTFNLGYPLNTVGGPNFNTTITSLSSGFEQRVQNWDISRSKWNIGDRTLTQSDLAYFIAFFRVARGAAVPWTYQDWAAEQEVLVRFEADNIDFRFDAYERETGRAIFYLAGVGVVAVAPPSTPSYYLYYRIQTYRYGSAAEVYITRTATSVRGPLGELNNPIPIPINQLPNNDPDSGSANFTHLWYVVVNGQLTKFRTRYDEDFNGVGDFAVGITDKVNHIGIYSVDSEADFTFLQAVSAN